VNRPLLNNTSYAFYYCYWKGLERKYSLPNSKRPMALFFTGSPTRPAADRFLVRIAA
jgi:hypothetical protein